MRKKQVVTRQTHLEDASADADLPDDSELLSEMIPKSDNPVIKFDEHGQGTLPDGTPVVEPVPVDAKTINGGKEIKEEQDTLKTTRLLNPGVLDYVKCTVCATKLQLTLAPLYIHPMLKVIVCKRCTKFYRHQKFKQDETGKDENCRWRGDGGDLVCCDICPSAFCKRCIKRNLGRSEMQRIESLEEPQIWRCLQCDPSPIRGLQKHCANVMREVKDQGILRRSRTTTNRHGLLKSYPLPARLKTALAVANARATPPSTDTPTSDACPQSSGSDMPSLDSVADAQNPFQTLSNMLTGMETMNSADSTDTKPDMSNPSLTNILELLSQTFAVSSSTTMATTSSLTVSDSTTPMEMLSSNPVPSNYPVGRPTSLPHIAIANPGIRGPAFRTTFVPKPGAIQFDPAIVSNQISNVNQLNIRCALRATRRCIDTFSADIRRLENKLTRAKNSDDYATVVQSFQGVYRFHLFARLANLSSRMNEDSSGSANLTTGPPGHPSHRLYNRLANEMNIASDNNNNNNTDLSDGQPSAVTIDLTDDTPPKTSIVASTLSNSSLISNVSTAGRISGTNKTASTNALIRPYYKSFLTDSPSPSKRAGYTVVPYSPSKNPKNVEDKDTSSLSVNTDETDRTTPLRQPSSPIDSGDSSTAMSDDEMEEAENPLVTNNNPDVPSTDGAKQAKRGMTAMAQMAKSILPPSKAVSDALIDQQLDTAESSVEEPEEPEESEPIQESAVFLEDIRSRIGDTSVVVVKDASDQGLGELLEPRRVSSSDDSNGDLDQLSAEVSALERACRPRNLNRSGVSAPNGTPKVSKTTTGRDKLQKSRTRPAADALEDIDASWPLEDEVDNLDGDETRETSTTGGAVTLCPPVSDSLRDALLRAADKEHDENQRYRSQLLHSSTSGSSSSSSNSDDSSDETIQLQQQQTQQQSPAIASPAAIVSPQLDSSATVLEPMDELSSSDESSARTRRQNSSIKYTGAARELMKPLSPANSLQTRSSKLTELKASETEKPQPTRTRGRSKRMRNSSSDAESASELSKSVKTRSRTRRKSVHDSDSEESEELIDGVRLASNALRKRKHSQLTSGSSDENNEKNNTAVEGSSDDEVDSNASDDDKKKKKKNKAKNDEGKKSNRKRRIRCGSGSDDNAEARESTAKKQSSPGSGKSDDETDRKGRKRIRKIYSKSNLSQTTKTAEAEERDRCRRISDRQKLYNDCVIQEGDGVDTVTKKLVLEKSAEGTPSIAVHPELLKHLKPHQVEAVRFIWDSVIESVERVKAKDSRESAGSGAILAHCMGLGKTLSVITFVHTLFEHADELNLTRCLVICPVNTLLNWKHECEMWLPEDGAQIDVFELASKNDHRYRVDVLKHWSRSGGIMLMGYDMFRNFVTPRGRRLRNKSLRVTINKALIDPGPDIVICDEGHVLKNDKSGLSKAVSQIRTLKRVILTGTPLQNNLNEYHAMVDFVKPNLLGTAREFNNRFVNPIRNGQCANSTVRDVNVMKKRAHILYKTLDGCIQRKDYTALTKYLPPRCEYVIMCRLSNVQCDLYRAYLQLRHGRTVHGSDEVVIDISEGTERRNSLFQDQQTLYRVWTHPCLLRSHETREARKMLLQDDDDDEECGTDESDTTNGDPENDEEREAEFTPSESSSSDVELIEEPTPTPSSSQVRRNPSRRAHQTRSRKRVNQLVDNDGVVCLDSDTSPPASEVISGQTNGTAERDASKDPWWYRLYQDEYDWSVDVAGKLEIVLRLLKKSVDIGDKMLLFTQSLLSLDMLERFLGELNRQWHVKQGLIKDELPEDDQTPRPDLSAHFSDIGLNTWIRGLDYERMDGSMNPMTRKELQVRFNRVSNTRLRLFIVSTRAGGLGINLVAANRLVLFDASWNPSHDIQSIFRSYRFGQLKPVYIYRLIAQATMEEKIYDRQVTKQSLSLRVIDEQQIDRHFSNDDLQALYTFEPDQWDSSEASKRPTMKLPKDRLLADMLSEFPHLFVNYHDHDSLLEHREDEGLSEVERKEAWFEYEEEKRLGMSLAQHQRMLQHQEMVVQTQQQQMQQWRLAMQQQQMQQQQQQIHAQQLMASMQKNNSNFPNHHPFQMTAQQQNQYLMGRYAPVPFPRMPNPSSVTPITPAADGLQSIAPKLPSAAFPYPALFEKHRAHVLRLRPNLISDPIQLEKVVLAQMMDIMTKEIRTGSATPASAGPSMQINNQPGPSTT